MKVLKTALIAAATAAVIGLAVTGAQAEDKKFRFVMVSHIGSNDANMGWLTESLKAFEAKYPDANPRGLRQPRCRSPGPEGALQGYVGGDDCSRRQVRRAVYRRGTDRSQEYVAFLPAGQSGHQLHLHGGRLVVTLGLERGER